MFKVLICNPACWCPQIQHTGIIRPCWLIPSLVLGTSLIACSDALVEKYGSGCKRVCKIPRVLSTSCRGSQWWNYTVKTDVRREMCFLYSEMASWRHLQIFFKVSYKKLTNSPTAGSAWEWDQWGLTSLPVFPAHQHVMLIPFRQSSLHKTRYTASFKVKGKVKFGRNLSNQVWRISFSCWISRSG